MSDKIEYSRLLMKRSTTTGEVPTIPPITATTLNDFTPTDVFVGEFFLNSFDDLLWIRTENGILPIDLSGSTGTTIPALTQVLFEGNNTNGYDIVVSSGDTIQYNSLPSGSTTTILGLDSSGNTITTNIPAEVQSLDSVLSFGNQTGANNIVVSTGQTIQYLGLTTGTTTDFLALDISGNTVITQGGADGTSGTSGVNGTNGTDGTSGVNGSSGTSGVNGTNGTSGVNGDAGSSGTSGVNGTNGTSGVNGIDGTSGSSGVSGTNGSSGTSGVNGDAGSSGTSGVNGTNGTSGVNGDAGSSGTSGVNGTNGTSGSSGISATGLTLSQVLTNGNETNGSDIIISTGDTIQSVSGENIIDLQDNGYLSLNSTYSLGGFNFYDEIKMNADAPSDANIEISSFNLTNTTNTNTTYRPDRIDNYSFDSLGNFTQTILDNTGFTIDLSFVSAGYLTINGLLPGTATDLLGIDANNRVVPYTISASTDYYVTGGTFSTSGGTLTLERNDGNDVTITGFTANVGCFGITIDGAGSAITTGIAGSLIVPYDCVIDCWGVVADQSGSIVVDVWKGSSPLTIPTSASDSIAGSEKPTLSSQQINTDTNLTTWTTNLVFGDVLVFNVDSASTVERITLQIKVIKL